MQGLRLRQYNKTKKMLSQIITGTRNAIKCSHGKAESHAHKEVKSLICLWCYDNNIQFMTEVVFKNNKRADILILDWGVIIEVLCSEKQLDKTKKYPFPIIPVSTSEYFSIIKTMLDDLKTSNGALYTYYQNRFSQGGKY